MTDPSTQSWVITLSLKGWWSALCLFPGASHECSVNNLSTMHLWRSTTEMVMRGIQTILFKTTWSVVLWTIQICWVQLPKFSSSPPCIVHPQIKLPVIVAEHGFGKSTKVMKATWCFSLSFSCFFHWTFSSPLTYVVCTEQTKNFLLLQSQDTDFLCSSLFN